MPLPVIKMRQTLGPLGTVIRVIRCPSWVWQGSTGRALLGLPARRSLAYQTTALESQVWGIQALLGTYKGIHQASGVARGEGCYIQKCPSCVLGSPVFLHDKIRNGRKATVDNPFLISSGQTQFAQSQGVVSKGRTMLFTTCKCQRACPQILHAAQGFCRDQLVRKWVPVGRKYEIHQAKPCCIPSFTDYVDSKTEEVNILKSHNRVFNGTKSRPPMILMKTFLSSYNLNPKGRLFNECGQESDKKSPSHNSTELFFKNEQQTTH